MILLVAFAITVLVGDLLAVGVAEIVERFSETGSLIVFLALFMGMIPLAWRIAVRATEPDGVFTRLWSGGARKS